MGAKLVTLFRVIAVSLSLLTLSSAGSAAVKMELEKFWDDSEPESLINIDHSAFKEILDRYVIANHSSGIARFDFAAVAERDIAKLDGYLNYLSLMEPRQLNEQEAKAYWVNLYNAVSLKLMINEYSDGDTDGVRVIRSNRVAARPWRRDSIVISQQKLSAEDLLNKIIRPMYKDPRIHFALFFFSLGGPSISTEILDGDNNEELLDRLEKEYLSQGRAVKMQQGVLVLSEIFSNFDTDFAPTQASLIDYIKRRVPESVAVQIPNSSPIEFEYDWTLNAP